jgi:outer membrane protein assembly factor BamB
VKRFLKWTAAAAVALVAIAAVLFLLGARVYLDGGGTPRLTFDQPSSAEQALAVEQHRAQQKATPTGSSPIGSAQAGPGTSAAGEGGHPALPPATWENDWTDFRGPARDGRYPKPILTTWPADGLKPLWKQPSGLGYASFAVADGRAFTIEQRGAREVAAAYDVMTGRELWTTGWNAQFREAMGGDGPRATPVVAGGFVHVLGAEGELRTLDAATGRTIWRANILDDAGASNLQWGMSAAPLVVDDLVIVVPGGGENRSVMAYQRRTGARAWSAGGERASYSSPMLVTLAGVRQILVFNAEGLAGLSPASGARLWEYPWRTQYDVNASQPLVLGDNRVFLSTGYGTGAAVIELARVGAGFTAREVWRNIRMKNQFTSSVLHDGFIYGLDESILACLDAATGELKWKGGRYGYGQVMLAGGHLIVLTEDGDLVLVRATPERHEERARFSALDGKTWNHPALSNGILLVRNLKEMAAFDLRTR